MAICKDCLYEEACNIFAGDLGEDGAEKCVCFKDRNRFVKLPYKVKDLIDTIISHNEIVAIWERRKNKEGRYHVLLWKGMAWDIPKEYLDRTFLKIFGTIPEKISLSDTVNIAVTPILNSEEEAEQALKKERENKWLK